MAMNFGLISGESLCLCSHVGGGYSHRTDEFILLFLQTQWTVTTDLPLVVDEDVELVRNDGEIATMRLCLAQDL